MNWLLLLLMCLPLQRSSDDRLAKYREASIKKFDAEIQKLEERDRKESDPENAILFVGSSSIRRWNTIGKDLDPWPTIQRGFGGSKFSDVAVFAKRIFAPHSYRALVVYVGNDITGDASDKTPAEIVQLFDSIVQTSKEHRPKAKIFLIAITPTEKRWAVWDKTREANAALSDYCKKSGLHFIETEKHYLNEKGLPRSELFIDDKLHQNQEGYNVWASIIRAKLEEVLVSPDSPTSASATSQK